MIISKQKPFSEIVNILKGKKRIFIIGCGLCATLCQSGGEEQVKEMAEKLKRENKQITGSIVIEAVCHILNTKKALALKRNELTQVEAILVMACGAGVQIVAVCIKKPVFVALDTLFIGNVKCLGQFEESCVLCGECILNKTGGICPLASCPKGLLNGPCGGMNNGKCEINQNVDCVWVKIYQRLDAIGQSNNLNQIITPKDYSKLIRPRNLFISPTQNK